MSKKANRILRILLVEDMPSVRNWEKMLLEQHNQYDVLEAENGQQAMEMIEKYHKQNQMIDLVLSDWRMPEMDGVQLYAEMKKYS
jgi:CheY-like chemotaxis protein